MKITKTTIWITGASSGIGRALALHYARTGARLVLSSRNQELLRETEQQCKPYAAGVLVLPLDLEDKSDYSDKVQQVIAAFGTIDLLILNGGISQRSKVLETPAAVERRLMEVNYFGTVALAKAVLPIMVRQQRGHLVVVSSIVGKFGWPLRSTYSAAKHALHGYFETLRTEHHRDHIFVTMILPGRVKTNISIHSLKADGSSHGKMDAGQAGGITAEACARHIAKAIAKKKKEKLVGGTELAMVWIRRWLPALYYKLVNKKTQQT
ncbi:MAG TPA: SDR family oxidoreductase [Bacteroidales bacterium]|nr:SDR family oxidoreductase [Bacteroidales bacterium]